jgi:hypothetical protein
MVRHNREDVLDIYRIVRVLLKNRPCYLARDSKITNMAGEKRDNWSVEADCVVKQVALVISTLSFIRVSSSSLDLPHRENEFAITASLLISSISLKLDANLTRKARFSSAKLQNHQRFYS